MLFRFSLVLFFITSVCFSQNQPADTIAKKTHSPKMAAAMSAIVPGLGQAYNKKYWKVPVIYAGLGGMAYAVLINRSQYLNYVNAYKARKDTDPTTIDPYDGIYSDSDLLVLKDAYRGYMELSYVGLAAIYVLNIIDASVDAHLFTFDVSDNLSMNIQPAFIPGHKTRPVSGFTFSVRF
jgi:hypothetical protein